MSARSMFYLFSLLSFLALSIQAHATPAFARQNNLPCAACHSAFPTLNATGRAFKSHGYRFSEDDGATKHSPLAQEIKQFPLAAAVVSRPYVKDDTGNAQIRAIHELEVFAGGVLYKKLSGFLELGSEGEDGFGTVLGMGSINYDMNSALHLQFAYAPTFFADPYDTLSSTRTLTAADYNIVDDPFGGADNGDLFRHSRQQVSLFGRLAGDKLFYNVGVGGLIEDKIGDKSRVQFARLAYDLTPGTMIGGFGLAGTCDTATSADFVAGCGTDAAGNLATGNRSFSRIGLDGQADIGPFRLTGVYMVAKDDRVNDSGADTNHDGYVQAVYYGNVNNHQVVPLLRYQTTESDNGARQVNRVLGGVTWYAAENFKASLEYGQDVSVPGGEDKTSNITVQLMAAF